jgi:hypothetical protein
MILTGINQAQKSQISRFHSHVESTPKMIIKMIMIMMTTDSVGAIGGKVEVKKKKHWECRDSK